MRKSLYAAVCLLLFKIPAFSQQSPPDTRRLPYVAYGAYWANLRASGFEAGLQTPLKCKVRLKTIASDTEVRSKNSQKYLATEFKAVFHPGLHRLFQLQSIWIKKKSLGQNWVFESAKGIGVARTFLPEETYQFADDGTIESRPDAGNFYLSGHFHYSVGWQHEKSGLLPYLRVSADILYPYNNFAYPHVGVSLGVQYRLPVNRNVRIASKTKTGKTKR